MIEPTTHAEYVEKWDHYVRNAMQSDETIDYNPVELWMLCSYHNSFYSNSDNDSFSLFFSKKIRTNDSVKLFKMFRS